MMHQRDSFFVEKQAKMFRKTICQNRHTAGVMKFFFIMFVLYVCLDFSVIFAQSTTQTYTPVKRDPVQVAPTPPARGSIAPLPSVRTSDFGKMLKTKMDTIERLLIPTVDVSDLAVFRQQAGRNERRINWHRATDTLETIAEYTDTNDLAKAYYFYGKGIILRDKAWSGMFSRDSAIIFARQSIQNFELYIQLELGNPAEVYVSMAMMYFDFLKNPTQALDCIDQGIALNPKQVYAYVSKAQILRNIGRIRDACNVLRQAREIERLQVLDMMWANFECR
jgi:tetratricopeptide (TPR) repeat protein